MADNYLEKKMEEHRSRQGSAPRRYAPAKSPAGLFPCRTVLVAGAGEEWEAGAVAALRAAGHRVAILNPAGAALAQATGARCYPYTRERLADAVADIKNHWGSLDIIVKATPEKKVAAVNLLDGYTATVDAAASPAAIALATHPAARFILSVDDIT